jgi:hypothetical protein
VIFNKFKLHFEMEDCKRYVKIGENNGKGSGDFERVLEK